MRLDIMRKVKISPIYQSFKWTVLQPPEQGAMPSQHYLIQYSNVGRGVKVLKLGSHVSFSKTGLLNATEEAITYGSTSFMVYTGAPQNTRRRPMEELHVDEGRQLMEQHGITDIVVHAPYIINLASYKENTFELAVNFLKEEINRTDYMGVKNIVLHPGAYTDKDPEYGIARIAEGLNEVLEADQRVHIALETMAGKGTEIGREFEE